MKTIHYQRFYKISGNDVEGVSLWFPLETKGVYFTFFIAGGAGDRFLERLEGLGYDLVEGVPKEVDEVYITSTTEMRYLLSILLFRNYRDIYNALLEEGNLVEVNEIVN